MNPDPRPDDRTAPDGGVAVAPRCPLGDRHGWLVAQLPQALAGQPGGVVRSFVLAFEDVAQSVRERIDGVEYQLDRSLAPPAMLRYLASWLGLGLEPTDPLPAQRDLVRRLGSDLLRWRGTRHGLEELLEAVTGVRVTVSDGGGVYGGDDPVPAPDPVVRVRLAHPGRLTRQQLLAFAAAEVPLGARVELVVAADADADDEAEAP